MRLFSRINRLPIAIFALKIVGGIIVLNLVISPILWLSGNLVFIPAILGYESLFITFLGALQILSSYIYKEKSIPSRWGSRTGWFDFKKFAEMEAKERKRYRQEGQILFLIGLMFLLGIIVAYSYVTFS